MRGRCERHQLALGPAGCLLCRRELAAAPPAAQVPMAAAPNLEAASAPSGDTQDAPATAAPSLAARQLGIRVPTSVLLLPFVGAGFYYLATADLASPALRAPVSATTAVAAATAPAAEQPAHSDRAGIPRLVIEEPAQPERRAMNGRERASAPATPAARDDASRNVDVARRELEAREIADLRERVDVIVYSTSWCPACRSLRGYLAQRGIRSTEYDIENDPAAKARQRVLNPRGSIPTVDIEGQVLVGFDAKRIEAAIDRAARARWQRL